MRATQKEIASIRQQAFKESLDIINKNYYARDPQTRELIPEMVSFKKKLSAAERHGTAQGAVHNFISSINKQLKEIGGIVDESVGEKVFEKKLSV